MDLLSFKLRLADRHARVVMGGARGDEPADLEGDRFERVAAAAQPLVEAVARRAGGEGARVRALSVDAVERVVRVSLEGGGAARLAGDEWHALAGPIALAAQAVRAEARPRPAERDGSPSEAAYWERAYREHDDGWELARAAPPLARWFQGRALSGVRALVAGCGRGHEARLLARAGARVTAVDFAAEAVEEGRALAELDGVADAIEFRRRDLFTLASEPERYRLAVEHTCFCAIDPARRAEWARVMADVLEPGGELIGLFWSHRRPGGPPFSVEEEELRALTAERFEWAHVEIPYDSVALRLGQERLVRLVRR